MHFEFGFIYTNDSELLISCSSNNLEATIDVIAGKEDVYEILLKKVIDFCCGKEIYALSTFIPDKEIYDLYSKNGFFVQFSITRKYEERSEFIKMTRFYEI